MKDILENAAGTRGEDIICTDDWTAIARTKTIQVSSAIESGKNFINDRKVVYEKLDTLSSLDDIRDERRIVKGNIINKTLKLSELVEKVPQYSYNIHCFIFLFTISSELSLTSSFQSRSIPIIISFPNYHSSNYQHTQYSTIIHEV